MQPKMDILQKLQGLPKHLPKRRQSSPQACKLKQLWSSYSTRAWHAQAKGTQGTHCFQLEICWQEKARMPKKAVLQKDGHSVVPDQAVHISAKR
mmetsp:Transcript_6196/g.14029  ORF Transcript_6196/g.14029 Transcript_6196/m.14029 type:complete len:94 (-) Transcript_6196:31-312(-)